NAAGFVFSQAAALRVGVPIPAPFILRQPQSQTAMAGADVSFTVLAVGYGPLTYQWLKNDVIIPDALSETLILPAAGALDRGNYSVNVTDFAGAMESESATLDVLLSPAIVRQPENQIESAGAQLTISVFALGEPPLSYQW